MSSAIADRRPAGSPSLRGLIARRPMAAFLVMAYAVGWAAPRLPEAAGAAVRPRA